MLEPLVAVVLEFVEFLRALCERRSGTASIRR
jgi:hypothetical protein